jgi:8-oxo-dGTP pyrophosphatase MutT (NUDIX family)
MPILGRLSPIHLGNIEGEHQAPIGVIIRGANRVPCNPQYLFHAMPADTVPSHPRRPKVEPAFDPLTQPWQVADEGLTPVTEQWLRPESFRRLWSGISKWKQEERPGIELRYPGREGEPVGAAVLVPLVMRPEGMRVMLTQRAAHLHDHAGQISFPGGRIEKNDASPVAAALREAREETGLPSDRVEVLGMMPTYVTSTGFAVTPVVGLVKPDFALSTDEFEVAEVFETPMAFLMNPANHRLYRAVMPDGRVRQYFAMPWENRFIWGATAGMLRNLYRTLRAAEPQ